MLIGRWAADAIQARATVLYSAAYPITMRGAMAKRWIIAAPTEGCERFASTTGVSNLIAQLLFNRKIRTPIEAGAYLSPQLKDLLPPSDLPGCEAAALVLMQAARDRHRIVLYGDYDVDGTTGLAILWHVLTRFGADVGFYVPHRIEEGYGLNLAAVRKLIGEGTKLIVTVDCGITAVEEIEAAISSGIQVIVTDHHAPQPQLPAATAIVHPSATGQSGNPHLCGAGVAFKLAWALTRKICGAERASPEYRDLLSAMLPLAALGTIADVVPLTGENRIIARHGLGALPQTRIPGLRALIASAGLNGEKIDGYDVGFKLAPRLNAAGRMGHAQLTVELLTRANETRSAEIAHYLADHNRARQSAERRVLKQACELIEQHNFASDARRAIVLAAEGWHPGVIGIVASRIVDRYHRPAVLIAISKGEGQGSARSVRHFDLASALANCAKHLLAHGGHAMAAGLRIKTDDVPAFTDSFVDHANQALTGDDLVPKLRLDAIAPLNSFDLPTTVAILGLGPFGEGNPKPRFATDWVELAAEPRCVGASSDHLQASFRQDGSNLKGIGFGLAGHIEDLKQHRRCRVAFEPIISEFNGRRSAEMQILDFEFPTTR
ncbi:MAG: single-stranded-DNA-specific exonuclease RecJ [Planctomycetes bacterium]|nr:single-stranded-DNA-specific exonuclease RecJ [Planctomycetota bacterium]